MMSRFAKNERQKIIDGYLAATGRNMFVAGEFIDWLAGQPDHPAHPWFFGKDDAEAAREYRIGLARQMAAGLRITARVSEAPAQATQVSVTVREFPAFISPGAGRRDGGGYTPFDPASAVDMAELRRQGVVALHSWLRRYRGAFTDAEVAAVAGLLAEIESDQAA
jgi:hypothetical protein